MHSLSWLQESEIIFMVQYNKSLGLIQPKLRYFSCSLVSSHSLAWSSSWLLSLTSSVIHNVWPFALKVQTMQQQIHKFCSLSHQQWIKKRLSNNVIMWIMQTDGTNLQQISEFYYTLHGYAINLVLGCIAPAPDPARDYWCANHSMETQANYPRLNHPKILQWEETGTAHFLT